MEQEVKEMYQLDDEVVKKAPEFNTHIMTIRNYPLDSKGRIMSDRIFKKWEECLRIYDCFQNSKSTKIREICEELNIFKKADAPNSYKYARDYREEAERLIKSAENGTFPN